MGALKLRVDIVDSQQLKLLIPYHRAFCIILRTYFRCSRDVANCSGEVCLLDHTKGVAQVAYGAAKKRKLDDFSAAVLVAAAMCHDNGKPDFPEYHGGKMNAEDKEEFRLNHSIRAEEILQDQIQMMPEQSDKDELYFLEQVRILVRYHHYPWEVQDLELRKLCYLLHFADQLCANCEDRSYRKGMNFGDAIRQMLQDANTTNQANYSRDLNIWISAITAVIQAGFDRPEPQESSFKSLALAAS